jgi:DNA ligase D-like protein (predicted polymerase)/DNA ligase D-like protein (predicted 3'-phosphoesterase)
MGLESYRKKRDFKRTPEPRGRSVKANRRRFVVQEHHASRLHFDFRLEMEGVLKSWSVPKGPTLDPQEKRLAVATEDHPVDYLRFEGHIEEGNYGAGEMRIWDAGTYEMVPNDKDSKDRGPGVAFRKGKLSFILKGDKLRGEFNLIRMKKRDGQWLLIKGKDEFSKPGWELETILPPEDKGLKPVSQKRGQRSVKSDGKKTASRRKSKSSSSETAIGEMSISAAQFFRTRRLSGDANVKVKNDILALTSLDKVYWPENGYTKGDLIKYYYEISLHLLPHLQDRPLILKRFPDGITKGFFYQHDIDDAPEYIRTSRIKVTEGHQVDYIIGGTLATLLYTANLGAIEQHPWHSRVNNLDHPDWIVFDLDPGEGVHYRTICEVALSVKEALEQLSLACYTKTSGSRGMHIYVPIKAEYDYEQVARLAEHVAETVADKQPEISTTERSLKKRRSGQVYVDHMQNNRGKSIAAPYSVRPRKGATVSTPLDWSEVKRKKVTPEDFTIKNIVKRIERKDDLFAPVLTNRQSLAEAMERLDRGEKGKI